MLTDKIRKDEISRTMWIQGFQHGNLGIAKQLPSYEQKAYEMGYNSGKTGCIEEYIQMVKEVDKFIKKDDPATRQKRKKKK
jgi:hypothetical protein